MQPLSSAKASRMAVLIDAENVPQSLIELTLEKIAEFGPPKTMQIYAYADWSKPHLVGWKGTLNKYAIRTIQQFGYVQGKNASDIALIIDAMDHLHSGKFDCFCLVSSDSDLTPLASRLRTSGLKVYGIGERKTPEPFRCACDEFVVIENAVLAENSNGPKDISHESAIAATAVELPDRSPVLVANTIKAPVVMSPDMEADETVRKFCGKLLNLCQKVREKINKKRKAPSEVTAGKLAALTDNLLALCAEAPTVCGRIPANQHGDPQLGQ